MKMTIIGAASPRFPLLLNTILQKKIPVDELSLYDLDYSRLKLLRLTLFQSILNQYTEKPDLTIHSELVPAVEGADFIFSSIRVGGQKSREQDEQIPLSFDTIGQETIGAGGFSLALRTIPIVIEQADSIHRAAPDSWLINFTNPAGIITQAIKKLSRHKKVIGICDAPEVITKIVSELYEVPASKVDIRYFGINHLGWVHSVTVDKSEVLPEIIEKKLELFFRKEPFYAGMRTSIEETGLLPNEYFYYYQNSEAVVRNQKQNKMSRASFIRLIDNELLKALKSEDGQAIEHFNNYMNKRNDSYMTNETGYERVPGKFSLLDQREDWGYDAVALSVLNSLVSDTGRHPIINIENGDYCPYLEENDTIEVSSIRSEQGFSPLGECPHFPAEYRDLLQQVKQYERLTVDAAESRDYNTVVKALKTHPIIPVDRAEALAEALFAAAWMR